MKTLDKESELLDRYRSLPNHQIKYIGNFFSCLRVERLTRSFIFKKSWIDSSRKDELPPDYHNDKHHIMMEMMRVDDCVGTLDGKHVPNAFEKENLMLKEKLGNDYKKVRDDIRVVFIPYTDDPTKYTYEGYINNFRNAVMKHSSKIEKYKNNYPKCKKTIFFISDESNEFCEVSNLEDKTKVENGASGIKVKWHIPHTDNRIIDIIKEAKCDYIIWVQYYKNKKHRHRLVVPRILIVDVKETKKKGIDYNAKLMAKVKEDHSYGTI